MVFLNVHVKQLISIGVVTLVLVSCQTASGTSEEIERMEVISLNDDKDRLILTDQADLNSFQDVFDQTEAVEGVVNVTDPMYRLEVTYTNEETDQFHLWPIDPEFENTLMKVEDTHTLYTVPKEMTAILQDLIEG